MHLKYTFETTELEGQVVAVPVGEGADTYHGVIKLNETAAFIFGLLDKDTSIEAIIDCLEDKYEVSRETLEKDVRKYISEFDKRGLLVK